MGVECVIEELDELSWVKFVSIGEMRLNITSVTFLMPARKSDEQQIVIIERVKPIMATAGEKL